MLLSYAMIKQESFYWRISTAVKLSRTYVQRSEQHIINKEQFIRNLSNTVELSEHKAYVKDKS